MSVKAYKLLNITKFFQNKGLIGKGKAVMDAQAPYWEKMLDEDYGTFEYVEDLAFLKELGYKIYRSDKGTHKLKFVEHKEGKTEKSQFC